MKNTFLFLLSLILFSCGSASEEDAVSDNPHHAAIPDSEISMTSELSEEDRRKIARAKGREAKMIGAKELNALLEKTKSSAVLCFFWKVDNGEYKEALINISELSSTADENQVQVALVHIGGEDYGIEVNAIVRETGVYADAFMMEGLSDLKEIVGTKQMYKGDTPFYYIYNAEDRSGMWLDGGIGVKELEAVLQPFMM